jgi:hypothetical protein
VTARYGEGETHRFDAVLQKQGDTLLLLCLTPLQSVAFQLRQTGTEVWFENRTGHEMPFDPRYILQDIQRAFFPQTDRDGEAVEEEHDGGTLRRRTFRRTSGDPPGTIEVRYDGPVVTLMNGWFGYELRIERIQ